MSRLLTRRATGLVQWYDPNSMTELNYLGFPDIGAWIGATSASDASWDAARQRVLDLRKGDPEAFSRAGHAVARAAALDSGALENLYETDIGFTMSVALQVAATDSLGHDREDKRARHFSDQLRALELVLDLVTRSQPISEAWIRSLHEVICASQSDYDVRVSIGDEVRIQRHSLPKGVYKTHPNHVLGRDGRAFYYAPPGETSAEMHRFCESLRSRDFEIAHPAIQAAYAHYAFIRIHPFADGNGRVARALASVFTYRALSVPLLILASDKAAYIEALQIADTGSPQSFVSFIANRAIAAVDLAEQVIGHVGSKSIEAVLGEIQNIYVGPGGVEHVELDRAGYRLMALVEEALQATLARVDSSGRVTATLTTLKDAAFALGDEYRVPVAPGTRTIRLSMSTAAPAAARVIADLVLAITRDTGASARLVIATNLGDARLEIPVPQVAAEFDASLRLKIRLWVDSLTSQLLVSLKAAAEIALRRAGY